MPMIVIKVSGKRKAHPAITFGLDDRQSSRLGNPEVGPADRHLGGKELAPQVLAGCTSEGRRFVGERWVNITHLTEKDLPDLRSVPVDRGHQDVRRLVMTELHDQLCKIGFPCGDAGCFQRLVEPDFLGGHGFDLDDLINALAANKINDDSVGLVGVASPVHHAAAARSRRIPTAQDNPAAEPWYEP